MKRGFARNGFTSCITAFLVLCAVSMWSHAGPEFTQVDKGLGPPVGYAVESAGKTLTVWIAIEREPEESVELALGVAAGDQVHRLGNADAKTKARDKTSTFRFVVPGVQAGANLRFAFAVAWRDRNGTLIRSERFRHQDARAPHAGLAKDPQAWQSFDLAAYEQARADRRDAVRIKLKQPMDGKLTVVIEDETGKRIRNLVFGASMSKGKQEIAWDCTDDDGKLVEPGSYRWRAISHPGIKPEYQMHFANGGETSLKPFGTNHGIFQDACSNGRYAFLAAPMTEGGNSLIAVDKEGKLVQSYKKIHGTGLARVAVAADDQWLYVAHDGRGWSQKIDKTKPDWTTHFDVTLTRYDVETGKPVDFQRRQHFAKPISYEHGPGAFNSYSLGGMALVGETLYISARHADALIKVDAKTATVQGQIALPEPGSLAVQGGQLYAVSGNDIVRVDPTNGAVTPVVKDAASEPTGLAIADDGSIYLADQTTHQIKVFTTAGKLRRTIGVPGGPYQGKYDINRLIRPLGIALHKGTLWVTEKRRNPKRVTAWDLKVGWTSQSDPVSPRRVGLGSPTYEATYEVRLGKYGNPPYGSPGAGFDPEDPSRWIGLRCQWKINLADGTATPISILQREEGHLGGLVPTQTNYRFHHQDGRTFLIGMGMVNVLSELMPDGSLRDLAAYSSCHLFCYATRWQPPMEFVAAFEKSYPEHKGKHDKKGPGVIWVDRNGDGNLQVEEFSFTAEHSSGRGWEHFGGSRWGCFQNDLSLKVSVTCGDSWAICTIKPDGFLANGVPNYPELEEAVNTAVIVKPTREAGFHSLVVSTAVDRFNNTIFNSTPYMVGFGADGRQLWRYPNQWMGVHGSHEAPLPETGVMQGVLFFLGMAPLDKQSDVFIVNGNHGRFFCLTSDGMYLDEMFNDVRTVRYVDENMVGGEHFGGFFGRSDKNGAYYLQTGTNGYRIYRVSGLDRIQRSKGAFNVSPEQRVAAEQQLARQVTAAIERKQLTIPAVAKIDVTNQGADLPGDWLATWGAKGRVSQFKAAVDQKSLYLHYQVQDNTPWVNNGADWQTLFKSGDSVDLQIGANPTAKSERTKPVPGDLRLLIAPYEGNPLAVLYRHRLEATDKTPVTFSSPWRSEIVDEVRKLEDVEVKVGVLPGGRGYTVTAKVPLANLGLKPSSTEVHKADFGVLFGDAEGTMTGLRSYWSNQATGLVNDVPGEIMLHPNAWGDVSFADSARVSDTTDIRPPVFDIHLAGVLANSGESGESLVTMSEPLAGEGLGVVRDTQGFLWDRAGRGQLNRYAPDGRLTATFRIPSQAGRNDALSIAGDTLVLLLNGHLYTLSVHASPGTEARVLGLAAQAVSRNARDGQLVVSQAAEDKQSRLSWLDPTDGRLTHLADLPWGNIGGIEVVPDGTIYVNNGNSIQKIEDGELVEDWSRPAPGDRPQFVDGAWFGNKWHSTVVRFNADLQADPGVVLGGASGTFIGRLAGNYELGKGRGLCRVSEDLYAISGASGVLHLMQWNSEYKKMSLVRRIGSVRGIRGLGLDRKGNIFARQGNWLWSDGPDAPQRFGINTCQTTQCVMLPNDYVLAFGRKYSWPGHPGFVIGSLDKEVSVGSGIYGEDGWEKLGLDRKRHYYGAAFYRSEPSGKGHGVLLLLDDKNDGHAFKVDPTNWRNCYRGNLGPVVLLTADPVTAYRSLAMQDADTLLAAADGELGGEVIRFARDGKNWKETARFSGGDDSFGSEIDIACDAGLLWVADTENHRVLCFDAKTWQFLASYGQADQPGSGLNQLNRPTTIQARGGRCILFDSGNQRLVKLDTR